MFQLILDAGADQAVVRDSFSVPWMGLAAVGGALLLVLVLMTLSRRLHRPEMHGLTPERVKQLWGEIEKMGSQGTMGAKLAVLEADKLLDGVLKSLMFPGETMGDRLKTAQYKYPNIRNVWPAHKLRNQLAHDVSFDLSARAAKQALRDFHAALQLLRVL